jgi:hypothetical protein
MLTWTADLLPKYCPDTGGLLTITVMPLPLVHPFMPATEIALLVQTFVGHCAVGE